MSAAPERLVSFQVDLVAVAIGTMTVRNRATGSEHTIGFDGIAIGADEAGEGYRLIMPRALAQQRGLADV